MGFTWDLQNGFYIFVKPAREFLVKKVAIINLLEKPECLNVRLFPVSECHSDQK